MILMRFPEGKKKVLTLSYDDGVAQDMRLADIMYKNGIKGTFNVPASFIDKEDATPENCKNDPRRKLSARQMREAYLEKGMEIAAHGYLHPHLEELDASLVCQDVFTDRQELEKVFGTYVRGMAYPYGTYNNTVKEVVKACGIVYARTVKSVGGNFRLPEDWLEIEPTCHHSDPKLFEYAEDFLKYNIRDCDPVRMFYLWGHSYEFDEFDNWDVIEKFCEYIGGRDDLWYATNIEIYDYTWAYKQLRFNVARTKVTNPTATDVWFVKTGKIYKIGAGETVEL